MQHVAAAQQVKTAVANMRPPHVATLNHTRHASGARINGRVMTCARVDHRVMRKHEHFVQKLGRVGERGGRATKGLGKFHNKGIGRQQAAFMTAHAVGQYQQDGLGPLDDRETVLIAIAIAEAVGFADVVFHRQRFHGK